MLDGFTPSLKLWITPPKSMPLMTLTGMVVLGLLLAGCNNNSGLTGKLPLGTSSSDIPPEVTAQKEILDTSALASLGRDNPFISLLEPPKTETSSEPLPEMPQITYEDPFEGFSVGGIVYKAKKPLAILTIPGGGNKIIHIGDTLPTATDLQARVSQIGKDTVTLTVINPPEGYPADLKTRNLGIAKLVGYQKTSGSSTRSRKKGASGDAKNGENPENNASPNASGIPPELQQLLGGLSGKNN